jgi:hypothetical protein
MTWRGSCGVQVRRDGGSKNPPIERVLEVAGTLLPARWTIRACPTKFWQQQHSRGRTY